MSTFIVCFERFETEKKSPTFQNLVEISFEFFTNKVQIPKTFAPSALRASVAQLFN